MKGRAVPAAYTDTGALNVACSHCGAEPGSPCAKADGTVSRVPCVDRLVAADLARTTSASPVVDYSEPRHPQEPT